MKIQENKIQEHTGTSFSITKVDGISILKFNDRCTINNIEDYATIMLGECTNCEKVKELYKDFTYDKVLVLGLGLGLVPETLKVEKECSVVDVVDNNQELIDYVDFLHEDINIISTSNCETYQGSKKYDLIILEYYHHTDQFNTPGTMRHNYVPQLKNSDSVMICPLINKVIENA